MRSAYERSKCFLQREVHYCVRGVMFIYTGLLSSCDSFHSLNPDCLCSSLFIIRNCPMEFLKIFLSLREWDLAICRHLLLLLDPLENCLLKVLLLKGLPPETALLLLLLPQLQKVLPERQSLLPTRHLLIYSQLAHPNPNPSPRLPPHPNSKPSRPPQLNAPALPARKNNPPLPKQSTQSPIFSPLSAPSTSTTLSPPSS